MKSPSQLTSIALYARYSSDLQREASIDDQLRICRDRAAREGWIVADVFSDAATSGATIARPGYQALVARLIAGGINIVVAESLDRFSRDLEHIAAFYKRCSFEGVRIFTLAEGDISELHVGLKGTMGAIYLKDLADKTRRGLEGRVRAGRCVGSPPYGYSVVRQLTGDGQLDRGLRQVELSQALVVKRVFEAYAGGASPCKIARDLNSEQVPGPGGSIWYEATIRGRPTRGDGLLRNPLYAGRIVWSRQRNGKDPITGSRTRRSANPDGVVVTPAPELRIVDAALWGRVQERLAAEAALPTPGRLQARQAFWDRRRPRHLLSEKVFCGSCGKAFRPTGRDYLGCPAAKNGSCKNVRTVRRLVLEAHVMELLHREFMNGDLLEDFLVGFKAEWSTLAGDLRSKADASQRDRLALDRKIGNLVDVISDARGSPAILARLAELEAARKKLGETPARPVVVPPAYSEALAETYVTRVASLTKRLQNGDDPEGLELARALIDRVIVHPPTPDGEPAVVELIGELRELLRIAGVGTSTTEVSRGADPVLDAFISSVKEAPGAEPLAFLPSHPQHVQRPAHHGGLVVERPRPGEAGFAHAGPGLRVLRQAGQGFGQGGDGGGGDQEAGLLRDDLLSGAADVGGDDGQAAEHGFDDGHGQAFEMAGQHEDVRGGEDGGNV
jgi:site-specific DNA recombinase